MKIPAYWFCFTLVACVICVLPIWFISVGRNTSKSLYILAVAYTLSDFEGFWRSTTFLLHILTASLLAIPITIYFHFHSEEDQTETQFSIANLLGFTTFAAAAVAFLQSFTSGLSYTVPVIFPLIGYALCVGIIAKLERRWKNSAV